MAHVSVVELISDSRPSLRNWPKYASSPMFSSVSILTERARQSKQYTDLLVFNVVVNGPIYTPNVRYKRKCLDNGPAWVGYELSICPWPKIFAGSLAIPQRRISRSAAVVEGGVPGQSFPPPLRD